MNMYLSLILLCVIAGCTKKPYEGVIKPKKEKITFNDKMATVKEKFVLTATKKHKRPKDLNLEEAYEELAFFEDTEQYERMERVLQRILALETNQQKVGGLMLKLAKIQTSLGNLEDAQKTYHSFRSLYPGHQKIKKAMYRELLTHFWTVLPPEKDQTRTEETAKLAQNFLEEFPEDTLYKDSVQQTLTTCHKNLLEGEVLRARHYLTRNKYDPSEDAVMAAHARLAYAEKEYLPKIAPTEAVLAQLQQEFNTITDDHIKEEEEDEPKEPIGKRGHLILAENLEKISDELLTLVREEAPIVAHSDIQNRF